MKIISRNLFYLMIFNLIFNLNVSAVVPFDCIKRRNEDEKGFTSTRYKLTQRLASYPFHRIISHRGNALNYYHNVVKGTLMVYLTKKNELNCNSRF